ncbi:hypothetical protein GCM10010206_44490 [Streptomyces cinerochromogenes]|nr:hypothetical protein GCM10010206_44490 [Streptomyces cinerochromogenes]
MDFSGQGASQDGAELTDWYTRNKVIMLLPVLGNSYCRRPPRAPGAAHPTRRRGRRASEARAGGRIAPTMAGTRIPPAAREGCEDYRRHP